MQLYINDSQEYGGVFAVGIGTPKKFIGIVKRYVRPYIKVCLWHKGCVAKTEWRFGIVSIEKYRYSFDNKLV